MQRAAGREPTREPGEDRQVGVEPIGETPVERDDESVEGGKNHRAFYGRTIVRAKGFVTGPLRSPSKERTSSTSPTVPTTITSGRSAGRRGARSAPAGSGPIWTGGCRSRHRRQATACS